MEENNIVGYIPNRPQFVYERPGFTYNDKEDYYNCPGDKQLIYKGTWKDGNHYNKFYGANKKECNVCSCKDLCSIYNKRNAFLTETIDRPYYARMHVRMQTKKAKRLMKKRQRTVEPVIGTLINYLGMKRVNTNGLIQANKCMTMAAFNIKKLLKHSSKKINTNLQSLKKQAATLSNIVLKGHRWFRESILCKNLFYNHELGGHLKLTLCF